MAVLPAGAALLGPLLAVVVVRLGRLAVRSDPVAQQSIVQTGLRVGHDRTYLPPDTWLLKLPVYPLFESLPISPSLRLIAESITETWSPSGCSPWACGRWPAWFAPTVSGSTWCCHWSGWAPSAEGTAST
ncbi:MAG TPA: hypothetical protein VHN80_18410 [Kineosporiaceae bacterium]|nr:hypothetical protein [Kineosporiaceae bacterium]